MAADTTSLANLIRPVVRGEPTSVKWSNKQFLAMMADAKMRAAAGPFDMMSQGGTQLQWNILRGTGNSATQIFTEATATPAAGQQTWVRGALNWIGFRTIVQWSGFAVDDLRSANFLTGAEYGEAGGFGEIPEGLNDLADLTNTTFLGNANNGLLVFVDDGTNIAVVAGLNRLTNTDLAGALTPVGGALTLAALSDLDEELSDNDIGQEPDAWFMPLNQRTNLARLLGTEATTSLVRFMAPQAGGAVALDGGYNKAAFSYMGKPVYGVPDMTDTVICGLKMKFWYHVTHRPIQVKELPAEGDVARRLQISTRSTLFCEQFRAQGILTVVNA